MRISLISLPIVALAGFSIYAMGKATPTGFLPEDDQGSFFTIVQLPDGASVVRTLAVVAQVEKIIGTEPSVEDIPRSPESISSANRTRLS